MGFDQHPDLALGRPMTQLIWSPNWENVPGSESDVWVKNYSSVVVQLLSHIWLFATTWTANCQSSLFFTISLNLLKLMAIESVMPSNHLIFCCPLLPLSSIFPSIRVISNELVLSIRWPNYWSFSLNISPSIEYSGLISFRIDWFNLLEIQGTLKSLHVGYPF